MVSRPSPLSKTKVTRNRDITSKVVTDLAFLTLSVSQISKN